ncbi:MAG: 1,4-alpha-glucan branching protein GlgB [Lachnospiraceae bacterium]|nr:1,4-alpha-glucan branching protein GlgB [Lachnospiraceae bacterium]
MNEKLQEYIDWIQYDELKAGVNNNPHNLLGSHIYDGHQVICAYRPNAEYIKIFTKQGKKEKYLEKIDEEGFFALYLEKQEYTDYYYEVKFHDGNVTTYVDPYAFEPVISRDDLYLFAESNHYEIYKLLGAHPMKINGVEGTLFAVWAPNARRVSVVGDFNLWDGRIHPMRVLETSGVHELFIPGLGEGTTYKFLIRTRAGEYLYKTDPYGNYAQLRPDNASVVADITKYKWGDTKWINARAKKNRVDLMKEPVAIYELHLGSWKKDYGRNSEAGFVNYKDIAEDLAGYVKDMGYTHVELMGIAEHPFDGSWGYQVTGYYAPTSRYGKPEEFMYLIDTLHKNGIGVILDWVPAHFPKDANGLGRFDGQPLYEHPDTRKGEHPHWGTYVFNYGKTEVANFLLANALFWLKEFHIDGLRVDAVASMLYLDYGKDDGQWVPNIHGGKENLEVIELLRHINRVVEERVPGVAMIAEESTSWAGVTSPVELSGLGFTFKWNMGWMNDFLEYMKADPYFRKPNHNKLTFSMMYAYSENFIQALSHDEVVHGKCSLVQKMPGLYDDKFANLKVGYGFMYGHPGKKLLFMGQEFAQWLEWSEERSLDWDLLDKHRHAQVQRFVKALNGLYKKYPAMYVNDFDPIGFEWMDCDNADDSIVAFVRRSATTKDHLLFVCNFTPMWHDNYRVPLPCAGEYTEVLNSDAEEFGGYNTINEKPLVAEKIKRNRKEYSVQMKIPPLSTMVFRYDYVEDKPEEENESVVEKEEKPATQSKLKIKTNKREIERSLDKAIEKSKNRSRKKK